MLAIKPLTSKGVAYCLKIATGEYYIAGGEPLGVWFGIAAAALKLCGYVRKGPFLRVCEGYSPQGDGKKLIQNAGSPKLVPAVDLCFTPAKSFAVVWALGSPALRIKLEKVLWKAVRKALRYLERNAAWTRRGKGGGERERAEGLLFSCFFHGTSRLNDPCAHIHALLHTPCLRSDGTFGAIERAEIFKHAMTAGMLFNAELSRLLEGELGFPTVRKRNWFEIEGIPEALCQEFSKRRQAIEEALKSHGSHSAKAADIATLATRPAKNHRPRAELLDQWQEVGKSHSFGMPQLEKLRRPAPVRNLKLELQGAIKRATARIERERAHFTRALFTRVVAEEAQCLGLGATVIEKAARHHLEHSRQIVRLGYFDDDRFSTLANFKLEAKLLALAERMKQDQAHVLPLAVVEKAIATTDQKLQRQALERGESGMPPTLSAEQRKMVYHLTQTKGVALAVGWAGSGKTMAMHAVADAYDAQGYRVIACALTKKAALNLRDQAELSEAYSVAKILKDLGHNPVKALAHNLKPTTMIAAAKDTLKRAVESPRDYDPNRPKRVSPNADRVRLDRDTVVLVDEASMLGTKTLYSLLRHADRHGARICLLGDHKQLQPVNEAGGPFKTLAQMHGTALQENRRQRSELDKKIVRNFADGQALVALESLAKRGLLHVADDREKAKEALIAAWKKDGIDNPKDTPIIANLNADVNDLNWKAQRERRRHGVLGKQPIRVNGKPIHRGDRVIITKNSIAKLYPVVNGDCGTVTLVDPLKKCIRIKLDSGKSVVIPVRAFPHVKLSYALTNYAAQGASYNGNAYLLLGDRMASRETTYVQSSRAKGTSFYFTDKHEAGQKLADLGRACSKPRQKDLAHDLLRRSQQPGMEYGRSR